MSCHFCRARAPFYALRGVMGSLGAEIPAGFYGVAETRSPAEGSAARAACLVGAVMQANRVLYAANVVRGWRDLHSPHEVAILHSDSLRAACGGCSLDAHCGGCVRPTGYMVQNHVSQQTSAPVSSLDKTGASVYNTDIRTALTCQVRSFPEQV